MDLLRDQQWVNFFICLSNIIAEEGIRALKGQKEFGRRLVFLNAMFKQFGHVGYVIMCARDQEIDPLANLLFTNCIQTCEMCEI